MDCTRLPAVLLIMLFTFSVSAQQAREDEQDLDVVASEDLVRELRNERQAAEPLSADAIEAQLAGGTQTLSRMIEQGCELHPMSNARILSLESLLASISSPERELERPLGEDDVRELKLALIDARQQALRDCCEQESVVCAE